MYLCQVYCKRSSINIPGVLKRGNLQADGKWRILEKEIRSSWFVCRISTKPICLRAAIYTWAHAGTKSLIPTIMCSQYKNEIPCHKPQQWLTWIKLLYVTYFWDNYKLRGNLVGNGRVVNIHVHVIISSAIKFCCNYLYTKLSLILRHRFKWTQENLNI